MKKLNYKEVQEKVESKTLTQEDVEATGGCSRVAQLYYRAKNAEHYNKTHLERLFPDFKAKEVQVKKGRKLLLETSHEVDETKLYDYVSQFSHAGVVWKTAFNSTCYLTRLWYGEFVTEEAYEYCKYFDDKSTKNQLLVLGSSTAHPTYKLPYGHTTESNPLEGVGDY